MTKQSNFFRSLMLVFIVAFGAFAVSAQDESSAHIRTAHLSFDAGEVDVYINGEAALVGVDFGEVSAWASVPTGDYSVAVAPTGTSVDDAVISADITLSESGWYTIAAIGLIGDSSITAQVIEEDFSDITPGETRLTVFHAIPNADPVSILANDNLLVAGLAYPAGEDDGIAILDVLEGTYALKVQLTEDSDTVIFEIPDQVLTANRNYFIAAAGSADSPELVFVSTNPSMMDEMMAEEDDMMMDGDAHIRVGHFSEDAPAVDVYIDGELSGFTGIEYPGLSEWVAVEAGTLQCCCHPGRHISGRSSSWSDGCNS